jgi:hypothetical protein
MKKQRRLALPESTPARLFVLALMAVPVPAFPSEPGTLGIAVNQLYSEQQPTKRGPFMVRRVEPASAAADARIQPGDLIIATDGKPVFGVDAKEMITKRLAGPAGSSIELTVVQADGRPIRMTLERRPYPPHVNPPGDEFSYSIPGNWQMDPRYNFPLDWAPRIGHKGLEDVAFAPGFDDVDSPEYHSDLFLWWLEGKPEISAAELQADLVEYFRGLAEQRGRNNNFKPDLSRVTAQYAPLEAGPSQLGGQPATNFRGTVTLIDRRGNVISLYSEVTTSQCSATHRAVFFELSKEPRPAPLWTQLDAVREGFKCRR